MSLSNTVTMHALLIGINQYASPKVTNLRGCVNDVMVMEQLLTERFAIPTNNIHILTDEKATHDAIKAAFREHLIEPTRTWAEQKSSDPPPAFLFYFSGHGSQAKDPTDRKASGMDETIVPHDSRMDDVYDIKDWEIGELLNELAQPFLAQETGEYNGNITVILDCCHSGSGVRDVDETTLAAKQCCSDKRPQPARQSVAEEIQTRSALVANEWMDAQTRNVLIAALPQ